MTYGEIRLTEFFDDVVSDPTWGSSVGSQYHPRLFRFHLANLNIDTERDGLENIVPLRYACLEYEVEGQKRKTGPVKGSAEKTVRKSPAVPEKQT